MASMPHVVLLGDSIFDNGAYVSGGPDVIAQLRALLPEDWSATLCALDGATTEDVPRQLAEVPDDATHLVLSVGGNDALDDIGILERPARSVGEALALLAERAEAFETRYRGMVQLLLGRALPITVCTVYNGSFADPVMRRVTRTALSVFDDAILRVAFEHQLDVIELRLVCADPLDYANPIEPSVQGGARIAHAIVRALLEPDALRRKTRVVANG
jgi:hypothetical protein